MAVQTSNPAIHVTGPVHLFVETPAHAFYSPSETAKIWYLGTCETQPQVKHQRMRLDVFNDIGGRKVPFQQIEQGEIGLLGFMLTRFSYTAYQAIQKSGGLDGNGTTAGMGAGKESNLGRGALSLGRTSMRIWMLYQFGFGADTPTVAGPATTAGLPRGRHYYSALLSAHEIADSGTAAEKLLLVFNALPIWLGTAGGSAGSPERNGFKLYSEAEADFPADIVNANTQ
jgi:hypothetical protein